MPLSFSSRPFRPAPTPSLYQPIEAHEAARQSLRRGLDCGESLLALDGPPGTGKTMLALRILADLSESTNPVYIPAASFERPAELYLAMLHDFEREAAVPEARLPLAVQDALLASAAAGKRTILVLDDAQETAADVLLDLRRFDHLSIRGTPALSVLLVGQHELAVGWAALPQRVGLSVRLEPLHAADAARFIRACVAAAGGPAEAFNDEAVELIAGESGGVPRCIIRIASQSLALALEAGADQVDAEAVLEALANLAPLPGTAQTTAIGGQSPELAAGNRRGSHAKPAATPKNKERKRRAA